MSQNSTASQPSFTESAYPVRADDRAYSWAEWLEAQNLSLAFTTYQTNRLFLLGRTAAGKPTAINSSFDRPMGLYARGDTLYLAGRFQLWELQNQLRDKALHQGCDRLYIPHRATTTGDVNAHELVLAKLPQGCTLPETAPRDEVRHQEQLVFVNTAFSCLAASSDTYSFLPVWQPPFISKLVPEDRCHLNGVAVADGEVRYVTVFRRSDEAAGWRQERSGGGAVLQVPSGEVVAAGLSMPHSPRWYRGKLWLLNSGSGELGYIDGETFQPVALCPGFARGLAFCGDFAIVGTSLARKGDFSGLALDDRFGQTGLQPQCCLSVVDLRSGEIVASYYLGEEIREIFDVVALPGVRQPGILSLEADQADRWVTFPGSGLLAIKPTAKPSAIAVGAERSGATAVRALAEWSDRRSGARGVVGKACPPGIALPKTSPFGRSRSRRRSLPGGHSQPSEAHSPGTPTEDIAPVRFQKVFHLNAENSLEYDALTFPSLKKRWQTYRQRGDLLGISASLKEAIVGLAIAEMLPDGTAEMLSLFVGPPYRNRGIGTRLVGYLLKELKHQGCREIRLSYRVTATSPALERILVRLGCQEPQVDFLLGRAVAAEFIKAPWLQKIVLPPSCQIFPWTELTAAEAAGIRERGGYPDSVAPFGSDPRLSPSTSLGLRYGDLVVGWLVTHRVAADTLRYTHWWTVEPYRSRAWSVPLLAAALQRQIAEGIPYYTFALSAERSPMVRFFRRRMEPYLSYASSSKTLCQPLNHL